MVCLLIGKIYTYRQLNSYITMKNFNKTTLLLVASILFVLTGCKQSDPAPMNSRPRLSYGVNLRFEDQSGSDLVKNITRTSNSKVNPVMTVEYNLAIATTQDPAAPLELQPLVVTSDPAGDYLVLNSISKQGLTIFYDQTNYKFVCPPIFGDDKQHTIVVTWSEYTDFKCLSVEVDGKEFPVSPRTEGEFQTATVVIDKVMPN